MKKEYEKPTAEFIYCSAKDIITVSFDITLGDDELPIVPIEKPQSLKNV
ncbi:MAG: hypothetical protein ACI3XX_06405 [Eubacteriales bacterium]